MENPLKFEFRIVAAPGEDNLVPGVYVRSGNDEWMRCDETVKGFLDAKRAVLKALGVAKEWLKEPK
jgi:hypothetical protein